jgi:transposase
MSTSVKIHLTASERKRLERQRATAKSRRLWARITTILMASAGVRATKISTFLSVCINTIRNWKLRWLKGRHFRLDDAPRSGRPREAKARYLKLLEEAVERGPQPYGYIFTVWNVQRLSVHLAVKTKIHLGPDRVRQLLHELGFVHGRPKHTLKSRQNRRQVRAAKTQLQALKKGLCGPLRSLTSSSRTKPTSTCILT